MGISIGTAVGYLDINKNSFSAGLIGAGKDLKTFESQAATTRDKFAAIGNGLTKIGTGFSLGVTAPLIGAGVAAVNTGIKIESAFAGVAKTFPGTEEQLTKVKEGIMDMTKVMPQSAVEISAVAEAAGQLGIKADNMLDFTKTMVMLGDSTNMSSDQAATALARLANITQMPQDQFGRLGSTVVDLGNKFATTEAEIVEMGLRLAGSGKQIGMTEAQTMGLAAALSSVGIEAEAGGSAMSKVMINMQLAVETGTVGIGKLQGLAEQAGVSLEDMEKAINKGGKSLDSMASSCGMSGSELKAMYKDAMSASTSLDDFAKVAGMSGDEFKKAFKEDAAGALTVFISGLQNAESHGSSAIKIINDMGITEVRMRDALLRAAGAGKLFNDAIETGTKAWEENVALTNEAEKRYATTESKLAMLKNQVAAVGMKFAEILIPMIQKAMEFISGLLDKLSGLSRSQQEMIVKIAMVAAAIGPLLIVMGTLMKALSALGAHPVVLTITLIVAAIALLVAAISAVPTEMEMLNAKIDETNKATEAWRTNMDNLDGSIDSFSEMTNAAGQTLSDLEGVISGNQEKINEIYAASFEENRGLREDEIESIQGYVNEITAAQEEMYQLYQAQLSAQVTMLQEQLKNDDLTYEQRAEIMKKLETAQTQYTDSVDQNIQRELAALTIRLQNGQISQEEYSRMTEEALGRQTEYAARGTEITQGVVDTNLAAMQKQSEIDTQTFTNLTTAAQSKEDIQTHYAQKLKEINDNETLNWFEKSVQIDQIMKQMGLDMVNFANGQTVTWGNYQFVTDQNIQMQAQKFFDWIGKNKSQGGTLSEDSRKNAQDIVNAYSSLPDDLKESGLQSLRGLATGMADEFPALKDAANMDMNQLIDAMNGALGVASPSWKMTNSGGHLLEGLQDGMAGKVPSLLSVASGIANGLINHFKNMFGVKSPSRIFKGIGVNLGEGLEDGLISKVDDVRMASEEMYEAAMGGMNSGKVKFGFDMETNGSGSSGAANGHDAPGGNVYNNTTNVKIESRPQTPIEIAEELRLMDERIAAGVYG